jgi:hypothetical protein
MTGEKRVTLNIRGRYCRSKREGARNETAANTRGRKIPSAQSIAIFGLRLKGSSGRDNRAAVQLINPSANRHAAGEPRTVKFDDSPPE